MGGDQSKRTSAREYEELSNAVTFLQTDMTSDPTYRVNPKLKLSCAEYLTTYQIERIKKFSPLLHHRLIEVGELTELFNWVLLSEDIKKVRYVLRFVNDDDIIQMNSCIYAGCADNWKIIKLVSGKSKRTGSACLLWAKNYKEFRELVCMDAPRTVNSFVVLDSIKRYYRESNQMSSLHCQNADTVINMAISLRHYHTIEFCLRNGWGPDYYTGRLVEIMQDEKISFLLNTPRDYPWFKTDADVVNYFECMTESEKYNAIYRHNGDYSLAHFVRNPEVLRMLIQYRVPTNTRFNGFTPLEINPYFSVFKELYRNYLEYESDISVQQQLCFVRTVEEFTEINNENPGYVNMRIKTPSKCFPEVHPLMFVEDEEVAWAFICAGADLNTIINPDDVMYPGGFDALVELFNRQDVPFDILETTHKEPPVAEQLYAYEKPQASTYVPYTVPESEHPYQSDPQTVYGYQEFANKHSTYLQLGQQEQIVVPSAPPANLTQVPEQPVTPTVHAQVVAVPTPAPNAPVVIGKPVQVEEYFVSDSKKADAKEAEDIEEKEETKLQETKMAGPPMSVVEGLPPIELEEKMPEDSKTTGPPVLAEDEYVICDGAKDGDYAWPDVPTSKLPEIKVSGRNEEPVKEQVAEEKIPCLA